MKDFSAIPRHIAPYRKYVWIADEIAWRIKRGELSGRLPAERALAAQFDVALGTVRHALGELRKRELVVTLPAKGSYVRPRRPRVDGAHPWAAGTTRSGEMT